MHDHDPIAESQWRLTAAECRVLLALHNREGGDAVARHEDLGRLFDDLVDAIAHHRAIVNGLDARKTASRSAMRSLTGSAASDAGRASASLRRAGGEA